MDILTFIDKFNQNFDKQPEPRYNTKKYFTDNVDDIGPGSSNRGKLPRLDVMPENYYSEGTGTGVMIDPRGLQDGKLQIPTQGLDDGGRVGFKNGNVVTEKATKAAKEKLRQRKVEKPTPTLFDGKKGSKFKDAAQKKEYIGILKKRTQFPRSSKDAESLSNKFLAKKYKATVGEIEKINSALIAKNPSLNKYAEAKLSFTDAKRNKSLKIVQAGKRFSGIDGFQFHHIMPIGGNIELTTKDVAFIDRKMNSMMSPYNKVLNNLANEAVDLLDSQKPGFLNKINELNVKAAKEIDRARMKLPKKFEGLIGFNKITPNLDKKGSVVIDKNGKISTTIERIGINEAKSVSGTKGPTVKLRDLKSGKYNSKLFMQMVASISADPKCQGKFNQGGSANIDVCFKEGLKAINSGKIAKGAQARNFSKFANRAYKLGRGIMKFGVIPEALFLGVESLVYMGMGSTLDEALLRSTDLFRPGDQTGKARRLELERTIGKDNTQTILRVNDFKQAITNLNDAKVNAEVDLSQNMEEFSGESDRDIQTRNDQRIKKAEADLKARFRPEADVDYATIKEAEAEDVKTVNSPIKKFFAKARQSEVDDVEQVLAPRITQKDLNKKMGDPMSTMDDYANQFDDKYLDELKTKFKNPNITKKDILSSYRQNSNFNKNILKSIFEEGRSSLANKERLLGANASFGGQYIAPRPKEMMASGGLANLTRTIPPEKGPQSQGLASFMKNGKR